MPGEFGERGNFRLLYHRTILQSQRASKILVYEMKGEAIWGRCKVRWLKGWIWWLKSSSSDPGTVNVYAQSGSHTYQVQSLGAPLTSSIALGLVQVRSLGSRHKS